MSVYAVKNGHPHLFEAGDFKYAGGINYKGIVVGASGLSEEQDDHYAQKLAEQIDELLYVAYDEEMKKPLLHILHDPTS